MTTTGGKKLVRLERDFNGGDPIDLTPYQGVLALAGNMGFNTEDALEAALVTATTDNMQLVTDYMFLGQAERNKKYEKRKQECVKEEKLTPEQAKHIEELKKYHREIQQEKQKIEQLQQELRERTAVTPLKKCVEYLRGIIADEVITGAEAEALDAYLEQENIDSSTYDEALQQLELTQNDIDDLKKRKDDSGGRMCIQCKQRPKECCIFPCMHVVLCEQCSKDVKEGPGAQCPVCHEEMEDIQRVYID
eukprot:CAMPEP_0202690544 /NCGR_PEP_ID=MMETSP1385-20130828/5496_1 /ASSEMBLY_ACC=CAM_ASM_000861 /TAXON_ID=933848 /ORGANISM="Elphidium margaritaceum" /LENGTH=248 /DNA_ID=CAMNT_0049345815 /DNA_START=26 /DNA_END=772 /DNA_ORIENTATION=+